MTLIDALDRLDALFSDESKWTKHKFFRGEACCLVGGIIKVAGSPTREFEMRAALHLEAGENLADWNDSHTFSDVKQLIADTRKRLEAQ